MRQVGTHFEFKQASKKRLAIHYAIFASFIVSSVTDLCLTLSFWNSNTLNFNAFFNACFTAGSAIATLYYLTNLLAPNSVVCLLNHCLTVTKVGWKTLHRKSLCTECFRDPVFMFILSMFIGITVGLSFLWGFVGYLLFWKHPRFIVNYLPAVLLQHSGGLTVVLVLLLLPLEFFRASVHFFTVSTIEIVFCIGYTSLWTRFYTLIR